MVGRNHVISNVASASALGCGLHSLSKMDGILGRTGQAMLHFVMPLQGGLATACYAVAGFALFLLGSLLPDIDSETSTLGRYVHLPVRHRHITHTAWVVGGLLLAAWKVRVLFWLALGYFLHIFWDGLSVAGICWFWPLSRYVYYPNGAFVKKGFRFKLYRTREASETAVVVLICVAVAFWVGVYLFRCFLN